MLAVFGLAPEHLQGGGHVYLLDADPNTIDSNNVLSISRISRRSMCVNILLRPLILAPSVLDPALNLFSSFCSDLNFGTLLADIHRYGN